MPRKVQRTPTTGLVRSSGRQEVTITDRGAGTLAVSYAYGQTVQASATVYAATAQVVSATVRSLAECGKAYFGYLEECQRTRQVEIWSSTVIAEARERTRQMEVHAAALIADAQEQTQRVKIQAATTTEEIRDTQDARAARMEIVRSFLTEHRELHKLLISQNGSALKNLTPDERVELADTRNNVLQRLRELESAIASLANAL